MAKVCSRGVARVGLGLIALLALAGGACSESETTRVPRDVATSGPRTLLVDERVQRFERLRSRRPGWVGPDRGPG